MQWAEELIANRNDNLLLAAFRLGELCEIQFDTLAYVRYPCSPLAFLVTAFRLHATCTYCWPCESTCSAQPNVLRMGGLLYYGQRIPMRFGLRIVIFYVDGWLQFCLCRTQPTCPQAQGTNWPVGLLMGRARLL